jgi:hypothetical protein
MSRVTRWSFTVLAVIAALTAPVTSHAQFGKLLKKKAAEKTVEKIAPASESPGTSDGSSAPGDADRKARQDAWDHPVAISASTLDSFLKAVKAENAERAKYIASAPPTSAMGRWNAYQTGKAKCKSDDALADSAQAKLQRQMMTEASAGHGENIQKYTDSLTAIGRESQERSQRCNALARPQSSDADWKEVHAEEDREEAAGAAAGGLPPLVYSRLKERVIAYTLMPSSWKANGYSADEIKALDARRAEIRAAIGPGFNTSGQRNTLGS